MFHKTAFTNVEEICPLNKPNLADYIIDQGLIVHASSISELLSQAQKIKIEAEKDIDGDNNSDESEDSFDLEAEIKEHSDSLFIKCLAIKADETNDNGDYFSKDQLQKYHHTFRGVPFFTNHQNTDINQARGKVVHSWWNDAKNGIMVIARIDAVAYPQLARGMREKYVQGVSMGTKVEYSCCSICHCAASEPSSYCSHIKDQKTRTISVKKVKCEYHKNGKEEKCPVCGSTKDDKKTFAVENQKVFEYNYGLKFIELSAVAQPACPTCTITEVIDHEKFLSKVADIEKRLPSLLKAASQATLTCDNLQCIKVAGQQEIEKLNQALNLLSDVSKSMLGQKDQIDLEFLSDLVQVLADLQAVTDELTEQGYGRLQSTPDDPNNPQQQSVQHGQQQGQMQPGDTLTNSVPPPSSVEPSGRVQSGPAGQVGTVTSPTSANIKKKLQLEKVSQKILKTNPLKINVSKVVAKKKKLPHEPIKTASIKEQRKLDIPFSIQKFKKNLPQ